MHGRDVRRYAKVREGYEYTMTITISAELEARLQERAAEEGKDPNLIAETLLAAALDWEAQERAEAIAGIERGLEASAAGRVRPASAVFAEMRARLPLAEP
jgi:predicted transcriptional regulator